MSKEILAVGLEADPLLPADAAEVPQLMAPHPEASFEVLEDEEDAARKAVGTGLGVVPFDMVKKRIEYVNAQGETISAEVEVPLGVGFGDDVRREQLIQLEEDRIDEAERRRGGKAGKGIEDIRREMLAERHRRAALTSSTSNNDNDDDAGSSREAELKEEMRQEQMRQEVSQDVDQMLKRQAAAVDNNWNNSDEPQAERVTTQQLNEEENMEVQEIWNGAIDRHAELNPALDEARSLKSYFGETLHEATEAKRRQEEEPERDRRLYYRESGVEDDEWSGAEFEERHHDERAGIPGKDDSGAREEVEAERYNAAVRRERKRRREEERSEGTPAFPVKRRNSLREMVAERMRREAEREREESAREEQMALQGRTPDEPGAAVGADIQQEDIYDYPANEKTVYYKYGAEQIDYGDMNGKDAGDYSTLVPFDGDDDLLRDEKHEEKYNDRDSEREGHEVLEEVREEVLMLEGCQSSRKLRPTPPSEDAKPLLRRVERLPARRTRNSLATDPNNV